MSIEQKNPSSSSSQGIKIIHQTDYAILTLDSMRTLFENKHFTDVVLIAGQDGKRVSAHRLVLSAASTYFLAMFTGSMREAEEKEVTLNQVQGDILQAVVEYCYSGRIQLRQDTVELLLTTASLFQMDSLVAECSNYLAEQLDASNCLGIKFFAEQHSLKDLQKKAEDCIQEQFTQVCENDEFLKLDTTQLSKLIASDDVEVSSEEVIFHSVMKWVNSDVSEREQHLRQLLPLVRMTQLSPSFIADHVETVCRSNDCQDLLIDAFKWQSLPEKRQEMTTEYTKPRNFNLENLLAIGTCSADHAIYIECYYPRSDKWTVWRTEISYRCYFGVATMSDNLFILGGSINGEVVGTVVSLNLPTLAITELMPMNIPRAEFCTAVLGNTLYAIGGCHGENVFNSVERWYPGECSWKYVAAMSTVRSSAGAAVLNVCIYVVGGWSPETGQLCTVECYNPRSNTWTECASMFDSRHGFGVAVSNGVLYAVGGAIHIEHLNSTVECYDPVADKWTMIEPMSIERDYFGCAVLGKCLMAVGGHGTNEVEEYDFETKKWSKKAPLTRNYRKVDVCVLPTRYLSNLSRQLK